MTDLHLVSHHLCPYVQRAVIVLIEKDIPHRRTYIDLADKPGWFLRISPLGRVPVLETGSEVVFESLVITEYLDEVTPGSLHPTDPLDKARHRSWIEFGSETLNAIGALYNAKDAANFEDKRVALHGKFARIEREVAGPYFSGDDFHLIDGVWGTVSISMCLTRYPISAWSRIFPTSRHGTSACPCAPRLSMLHQKATPSGSSNS